MLKLLFNKGYSSYIVHPKAMSNTWKAKDKLRFEGSECDVLLHSRRSKFYSYRIVSGYVNRSDTFSF